jgi:TIR domain
MKIFISWSGHTSHKVAIILRDWLPSVIQSVVPYVSSEDIDKGARWATDIAGELDQSSFGLLCVTKDNVNAPWLNFEAGALGKSVDKSRVCPILYKIKRSEIQGPILQFQSTICEKEDVFKLLKSINDSCDGQAIPDVRLEKTFDVWWPSLKKDLEAIPEENPEEEIKKEKHISATAHIDKILEEVLELSRVNLKILRNPDELLPAQYLEYVFRRFMSSEQPDVPDTGAIEALMLRYMRLQSAFSEYYDTCKSKDELEELKQALSSLGAPVDFIFGKYKRRDTNKGVERELARPKSLKDIQKHKTMSLKDFAKDSE